MLVGSALCAVCGASVAIAFAAPSRTPDRATAANRACHRDKRGHCHMTRTKTSRHKHRAHKQRVHVHRAHTHSQTLTPAAGNQGQGVTVKAPGTSAPAPTSGGGSSGVGTQEKAAPVNSPPPAPAHVEVTAEDKEDFRFVLSRSSVPAGKTILEFVNHGQDEHNLNAVESQGEVVGSLPNTPSNGHPSLTVDLKPGSYTLFCSLPGHAAKGMKATLTVE